MSQTLVPVVQCCMVQQQTQMLSRCDRHYGASNPASPPSKEVLMGVTTRVSLMADAPPYLDSPMGE